VEGVLQALLPQTASHFSLQTQEEERERGETAEARRQQLEDILCSGPGPQCPPKEAPALAGRCPSPATAFRSEAVQSARWGVCGRPCLLPLLPLPAGSRPDTVTLRSAKSEESLSSQASGAGEHRVGLLDPS
jgi:hypothetical protein